MLIGQQGIALIDQRVSAMGYVWYPTGGVEAGIDGEIELRDPESGEVRNARIYVQSKATAEALGEPGSNVFSYTCEERDINYWMEGNAPVILVRSRPEAQEAFWVSIKDYFRDPVRRKSRKITFDKQRDRFDASAQSRLRDLAIPPDRGVYFSPARKRERLVSNLLPVSHLPQHLYLAGTSFSSPKDLKAALKAVVEFPASEWFLHEKRLYSFHDLAEFPWSKVCDRGTVEPMNTSEWADSEDQDRQRQLVRLLNHCLRAKLAPFRVWYHGAQECYFFRASENLRPRRIPYRSAKRVSRKTVFQAYPSKRDPKIVAYYRHTAFRGQFRRFGGRWFLEIVPTYLFTHDGHQLHPGYESKLKGIKAQEHNNAVRSHVLLWADVLGEREQDLFSHTPYLLLRFDRLSAFDVEHGLDDDAWIAKEDADNAPSTASDTDSLDLFDDED